MAQTGRKIILHYFDYNPLRNANGLEDDCITVYAYKRKSFLQALPLSRPFIVGSRANDELIRRLNEDDHSILLEGLHSSGIIPFIKNPQRIVLRMHNDEAAYYHHLAQTERQFLKRVYFKQESRMLASYQQALRKDIKLACLSESDIEIFTTKYGFAAAHFIHCFIPWQTLSIKEGKGAYCLYHGNMSVSENEEAALWLMENVFSKVTIPFIVAGKGISKNLEKKAAFYKHVSLVNNPSIATINNLICDAQVNVLPSMNNTGVKLKLLNALLNGRHCITNTAGVKGSSINNAVTVANSIQDWVGAIGVCMHQNFTAEQIEDRKKILDLYGNEANAGKLNALWSHCQ